MGSFDTFDGLVSIVAAVILFMYRLHGFAKDLQTHGGQVLRSLLESATRSKVRGLVLGAALTAIVQSLSAVTAITAWLVAAALMSFRSSHGSRCYDLV